jgi:hypothetical protein
MSSNSLTKCRKSYLTRTSAEACSCACTHAARLIVRTGDYKVMRPPLVGCSALQLHSKLKKFNNVTHTGPIRGLFTPEGPTPSNHDEQSQPTSYFKMHKLISQPLALACKRSLHRCCLLVSRRNLIPSTDSGAQPSLAYSSM